MTEAEYEKLVEKYGKEATDRMIEKLDNAKGAKGYTYKSDYRAILSWVAKEVVEELEKEKRGGAGGYGFSAGNNAGGFKPSGGFKQQ
jgi:NADH:ubiquinone oxidoreductase subunit F (NADH-binding)